MRLWMRTGFVCLAGVALLPALLEAADAPPESLDVTQAVRIALDRNYGYRQSEAGVAAAEGDRLNAIAGLLPQASGSYAHQKGNTSGTTKYLGLEQPTGDKVTVDAWSGTLTENLSLPLWFQYRGSQAGVQGARYGRQAAAQDLAFSVRQQFYLVLRAQALLTVQEDNLKLAQDQERRIQSMFELGSVARVDVLKAQVQVSNAELALIQQQNAVDNEQAILATLLGYPAGSRFKLAGNLETETVAVDSASAHDDARNRPDLNQARENLRGAQNNYKAALFSRFPSLFASYTRNSNSGSDERTDVFADSTGAIYPYTLPVDFTSDAWQYRVGASINLDAFFNSGSQKRAHAEKRRAEYALQGLELDAQREVEEAILNYRAGQKAIESAQRGVESAKEDLRLSQERYQQGLGTVLELLEAQVNLTKARSDLVNAQTVLKVSEAALDKARGAQLPE